MALAATDPPSTPADDRPSQTIFMSKEDYERYKEEQAEAEYQAEKRARKRRLDLMRDAAKEDIYRRILLGR